MNKFIAITGMCGAGKTTIARELSKKGYQFFRFGAIVDDIMKQKKLKPSEANEKMVREMIREKHGPAAYAILNIEKIDSLIKTGNVVSEGLFSWSDYEVFKQKYGPQFIVLAVYAPPEKRYEWLVHRKVGLRDKDLRNRPLSKQESITKDIYEIENMEKAGPIAMADFTIMNTGSIQDMMKQLQSILDEISDL
jgi:dephospho-CoA kinase